MPLWASVNPEGRVSMQSQHPRVALGWAGRLSGPGARMGLGTLLHRALAGSSGAVSTVGFAPHGTALPGFPLCAEGCWSLECGRALAASVAMEQSSFVALARLPE